MKKNDILSLLSLIAEPAVLIVVGLILLLRPDAAPALIARVLGWAVILVSLCFGISAVVSRSKVFEKGVFAIGCLAAGIFMVRNPLHFTAFIGQTMGIVIAVIAGIKAYRRRNADFGGPAALFAVGALLILMPRTASRLVFSLCGLAVLAVGVLMLLSRLRRRKLDGSSDDPNIIDAL